MPSPPSELSETAAVFAMVGATRADWYRTADLIEEAGSALRLLRGDWTGLEPFDTAAADEIAGRIDAAAVQRAVDTETLLADRGIRVLTVLDREYPVNLRFIFNRPPFLTVRGKLTEADSRAIAVVGTRGASPAGLEQAVRLASGLAHNGVTVLSGLAEGIDGAAHGAALEAGGRTLAVIGTGILRPTFPRHHDALAEKIVERGAVVSQFWPEAPPAPANFLMRNVTTSGMALGTVVIEASSTSGAKSQARRCLEHGKRLFLVESLVMQEAWARKAAEHPGATVIQSVDDILEVLVEMSHPVRQLALG